MSEFTHPPIHDGDGYRYVRLSEMHPEERVYVEAFMYGAAHPVPDDSIMDAIYLWDYQSWLSWQETNGSEWRTKAKQRWRLKWIP